MDATDALVTAIHVTIGFILVYFAAKAYRKTKYPPMLYLVMGFTILILGETVVEDLLYFLQNSFLQSLIAESFEIIGFVVLILAVKKS